jgi:cell division protein FtsB
MPPQLESNTEPRRPRGPEPLRRKRVQPVPALDGRRRKLLNLLLGFAAVVLLVDALVGEKGFMDRMRAKREYQQHAARLDALHRENQALVGRATRLKTDPAAIESIAREEMGLMKKGELLFIVRDVKPAAARPSTTAKLPH